MEVGEIIRCVVATAKQHLTATTFKHTIEYTVGIHNLATAKEHKLRTHSIGYGKF
jgi:hypothetical protein